MSLPESDSNETGLAPPDGARGMAGRVVKAVIWRSGSQIVAQLSMWASTFWVLRLLSPADYGLYAMTTGVMVLLGMLSGQGMAGAIIRAETVTTRDIRQVFGLLLVMNGAIALAQVAVAPFAAHYFRHPLVAQMLQVQALLYLANPLIALPSALLSRQMDFTRQAKVNIAAALVGAIFSLTAALSGLGVWTLVCAPLVLVWTRAIGLTIAARMLVWPSFRFGGAGATLWFGGAMLASDLFWFVQTQADVVIGGRVLDAHRLGVYTTSLFLVQIVTSKFIPPLNEVAFTAYTKLQNDRQAAGRAFEKSVQLIMMVALPFYFGLAVTAQPLVETMLGAKWTEAAPVVTLLAMAMPFLTLQILFTPATTALGHTRIQVISALAGAIVMPVAFLLCIHRGVTGLASAWLFAMPILTLFTARIAMPVLGTSWAALLGVMRAPLLAAAVMAVAVALLDREIGTGVPALRLFLLVSMGAAVYGLMLLLIAKSAVMDMLALLRARQHGTSVPA